MSDHEHARVLLKMARKDLSALLGMREHPEAFADEVFGFHAQQAVEKALKAWIAARGLVYPFSHDLSELFALLEADDADPQRFAELMRFDTVGSKRAVLSLM